jgi:GT2 family glycosyltransferase
VAALHQEFISARRAPEVIGYGRQSGRARVSVIVPVYRNLEFLRAQHAAFALDSQVRDVDLIYVLDSPDQRTAMDHLLRGLHATYAMPCRLAVMNENRGFAAACNAGAALASGQLILPLNSDIMPASAGWLARLVAAIDKDPRTAAVGPKLLYHDDSLQHAGLYFEREADSGWRNHHFFKGYPCGYPEANRARRVPGLTGAAILLRRELFDQVGGFCEDYVIGDYEDSDLCLKLQTAGFHIWYEPSAELYHFERRSMPLNSAYWLSSASEYNRVLHESRWHAAMAGLSADGLMTTGRSIRPLQRRRRIPAPLKLVETDERRDAALAAK